MEKIITAFLWTRNCLRRVKLITSCTDLEKKPDIPEASGTVRRLKEASDRAHARKRNILNRWKRNT